MTLQVTNLGTPADFEAQIEIIEGVEAMHGPFRPTNPYAGSWETSATDKTRLLQGHRDRLVIGLVELAHGIMLMSYQMFFTTSMSPSSVNTEQRRGLLQGQIGSHQLG